jgi:putative hydrolase of the HAD superfamily
MRISAIFFDAVGTLLEPTPAVVDAYLRVSHAHGFFIARDELKRRMLAAYQRQEELDLAANWQTSEARESDRWRTVVGESFAGAERVDAIFEELHSWFAKPEAWTTFPDALLLLKELPSFNIPFGLASNYDHRLRPIVDAKPELALFRQHLWISSEMGCRKPGRAFFEKLIDSAGCPAGEILYVGDDVANDYHGALTAGMQAILIDRDGKHPECQSISRIAQLLSLLSTARAAS